MNYNKLRNIGWIVLIALSFIGCKDEKEPATETFKLPSPLINKIAIDNNGVKWFATGHGIVSFDGTHWTAFQGDQTILTTPVDELTYSNSSGHDEVWLGSKLGVSVFSIASSPAYINFDLKVSYDSLHSDLLADSVNAISIDENNVKYIGTSGGLSILKGNTWTQFMGRRFEEILSKYKISAIATASNGRIYAATEGGGVSSFKYADAVTGATTFSQPWSAGLKSDTVYTVIVIENDHQWYGTNKGAVLHTTEFAKSDWESYSRADGLICDSVYAIGKDQSGNVWFGTHKGVSKYNGTSWTSFTTKDGLIENKINTLAIDKDGSVWFGTDKGISHFTNNQWINY